MRIRSQLVKSFNTVLCISASFLATRIFISSAVTPYIYLFIVSSISSVVNVSLYNISSNLLKTGFLVLIIVFNLLNMWSGKPSNVMRIYYLNILLIIPEAFSHSKFQWLYIFFGLDVYNSSKTFIEILFASLVIIGGYMILFFDSNFRENSEGFTRRGINMAEIDNIYSNQFIMSLTFTTLSFFIVIMISFLIEVIVKMIKPITNLSNVNYILLGILSSVLISSTLYIFLKEQSN